jgi:hypothetical protein
MSGRAKHAALLIAWWLVLLGLAGEFGTNQGQKNGLLPVFFVAWIAFGVWRFVVKDRRRRREAP